MMGTILLHDGMARWRVSTAILLLATGIVASDWALAQISLTKHNLGGAAAAPTRSAAAITEICVFCHTPFGADTSATAPLWDRTLLAARIYTTYNSLGTSSLDGATAPVGSVSIACLSCHDGVQSLNVMINAPGAASAGAWTQAAAPLGMNAVGTLLNTGVDLRNDHPFGRQYGGGAVALDGPPPAPSLYLNTLMRDSDFSSAQSTILNGQPVWWVDTAIGTAGARDKTDVQLYTRVSGVPAGSGDVAGAESATWSEPLVECASCHDPHSAVNGMFLRYANTASALCLACHAKM